jgi:hypothetical protein
MSKLSQFAPCVFFWRRIAPCSRTVFRKSIASALIFSKKVILKPTAVVMGLVGMAGLITSKLPTSLTVGKPVCRMPYPKLSPIWSCWAEVTQVSSAWSKTDIGMACESM